MLTLQASGEASADVSGPAGNDSELFESGAQTVVEGESPDSNSAGWAITGLGMVGALNCGYLTLVKVGQAQLVCPASSAWGCLRVLTSPWATIGPIPLASVGLVAYIAIVALSRQPGWEKSEVLWWLCLALATASLGLMAVLIFVLEAPCTFCALSAFISSLLLVLLEVARAQATGAEARRSFVVLSSLVALGAFRGATMIGKDDNSFYALVEKYKPEHPPVRSTSSEADMTLARHLKTTGAACYTAWWCPHCQDQREKFGREATALAPFVECSDSNRRRTPECRANKDIEGFPTWRIAGKLHVGAQELSKLAELSGFTEFTTDAFSSRSDEVTAYIWGQKYEK